MIDAYLTQIEITRTLGLPDPIGRIKIAMWKMSPSFPKPEPGTGGRRYFPLVVQWLRRYHHVDASSSLPVADERGVDFDAWRAAKKTRKAARPGVPRPGLPPQKNRLAPNLVAEIGPGGKRVGQSDVPAVAPIRRDRNPYDNTLF